MLRYNTITTRRQQLLMEIFVISYNDALAPVFWRAGLTRTEFDRTDDRGRVGWLSLLAREETRA